MARAVPSAKRGSDGPVSPRSPVIFVFAARFGKIKKIIEIPNLIEIQKRSYEEFLQAGRSGRPAHRHGLAGGFQVGLSDQGLQRDRLAGIRHLRARRAQVRRRGMPSARDDLRRAAEGQDPTGHLGRRERPALDQERQGAGSLLRRDSADDRQRDLHGQRHRAGNRLAAPSLARGIFRARQGPHAFHRQAALLGANHSVSRELDRFRIRPARRALRAHRSAAQVSRHGAAARARDDHRGPAQLLLQARTSSSSTPSSCAKQFKPDQLLGTRDRPRRQGSQDRRRARARGAQVQQGDRARAGGGQGQRDSDRARRSGRADIGP